MLLLEAATDFTKRFSTSPAFGLVSAVPNSSPLKSRLMWPAVALAVAMVATQVRADRLRHSECRSLWAKRFLCSSLRVFEEGSVRAL